MTLVLQKRNIQLTLLGVILVASVVAVVFQKEIRIAYHKNRLKAGARYCMVATGQDLRVSGLLGFLEERLIRLGRGNYEQEMESMNRHTQALMDLNYFVREEFPLHDRLYVDGTNRLMFHQLLIARFDFGKPAGLTNDWWDMSGTESNKIVIITTKELMPKWKKLAEDFDRP